MAVDVAEVRELILIQSGLKLVDAESFPVHAVFMSSTKGPGKYWNDVCFAAPWILLAAVVLAYDMMVRLVRPLLTPFGWRLTRLSSLVLDL
jgi:hypothetical protein